MINCHPIFANYITKNLNLPTVCPCCGGDLTITESGFVECRNLKCKNKVKHMFAEFFGKLEIEGAGEGFIENLADHMSTITEVVLGKKADFEFIAGSVNGAKIHNNMKKALAKPMTLAKFVSLFDLRGFGEKKFLDLDKLEPFKAFYEEPEAVLAAVTAQDIIKHHPASMVSEDVIKKFAMEFCLKREDMVNAIKSGEFTLAPAVIKEVKDGKLTGKSFCFTGKAESIGSRSKCEELVIANGGTISSVKKGLSFLVQEDPSSTSSKSVKARSLGISIISPEEFLEMIR
jgi:NAD-dependent DNA ligase